MLQFNSKGLLIPDTIIPSTLEEFEQEFVIKPKSEIRKELFDQYRLYCKQLKNVCEEESLVQWINGSFTTKSKAPNDIDLVTFVNAEIIKKSEPLLKKLIYPQSLIDYRLDAYLVAVYPDDSRLSFLAKSDRLYWENHFGKTKPDRYRKHTTKGFLEIII